MVRFRIQGPTKLIQKPSEIPENGIRFVILAQTRVGGLSEEDRHLKIGIAYGDVESHIIHEGKLLHEFGLNPSALSDYRHGWVVIHGVQYLNHLLLRPVIGRDMNHIDGNPHHKTVIKVGLVRKMLTEEVGIPRSQTNRVILSTLDQKEIPLNNPDILKEIARLQTHTYSTLLRRIIHSSQ